MATDVGRSLDQYLGVSLLNVHNGHEIACNRLDKTFNFVFKIVQKGSFSLEKSIKRIESLKLIAQKLEIDWCELVVKRLNDAIICVCQVLICCKNKIVLQGLVLF